MSQLLNMFTDHIYAYGLLLCLRTLMPTCLPTHIVSSPTRDIISSGSAITYPAHTTCFSWIITLPQLKLLTPGVPESLNSATSSSI